MKHLATKVGLSGKFTNHSLHATSAMRMFSGGIPEKVIKEITGHRSDAVRLYERTGEAVKHKASSILSCSECKPVPKFDLVSLGTSLEWKFEQVAESRQKNVKIDVHKCIESAGVGEVLDSISSEKVKSVKITI